MTLHIYLGCDLSGQLVEFQHQHEVEGFMRICRHLWDKFQAQDKTYALVANVRCTSSGRFITPDLVLISELGLGVLELKHSYGVIDCGNPKGTWRAGPAPIRPYRGTPDEKDYESHYNNPHEQIRDYARQIRDDLIPVRFKGYFNKNQPEKEYPKIGTAVCFTHPDAILAGCQAAARVHYRPGDALERWETFQVLSPAEMPEWAMSLRFGMDTGYAGGHLNVTLLPEEVDWLARDFFKAQPWEEMVHQVQTRPEPYAYLALVVQGRTVQYFPLVNEEEIIGRDGSACSIVLSERYTQTSRKHLRLLKGGQGIFIEDLNSSKGSYLDSERIQARVRLESAKKRLTLGGSDPGPKVPELRLVWQIPPAVATAT